MNAEELAPYISGLEDWFRDRDVQIDPLPEIIFDDTNSPTDIFAPTGFYDADTKTITVYVNGRHIKDIMRTFAAANTKEIAKTTAGKMADAAVADAVAVLKSEGLTDDLHAPFVARVLMHAAKSAVVNPPCLPFALLDDLCEFCEIPKEHRPE